MSQASPSSSCRAAEGLTIFIEGKINTIYRSFPPTRINTVHSPSTFQSLLTCFSPFSRASADFPTDPIEEKPAIEDGSQSKPFHSVLCKVSDCVKFYQLFEQEWSPERTPTIPQSVWWLLRSILLDLSVAFALVNHKTWLLLLTSPEMSIQGRKWLAC